jgi:hypothetical protein
MGENVLYSRNCPCCNTVLTYSTKSNRDTANKVGRKCVSCGHKGRSKEEELKIKEETCTKCNQTKSISEFRFRKDRQRYHTVCNTCTNARRQKWRKENPEGDVRYYYENQEKNKIRGREYYQNNKELVSKRGKEYHQKNKIVRNKKINDRYKHKLKTDPLARLKHNLRGRLNSAIRDGGYTKRSRTMVYLGCEFSSFKLHLESQFEPWMTWDNYGGIPTGFNQCWDVDHIIPISTAMTEEEIYGLTNYKNLRPLCSYYNRYVKSNKIEINE